MFLVWTPGKMNLLSTEMGKTTDRAGMRYEKQEFAWGKKSLKFNSAVLSCLFSHKLILIVFWFPGYNVPQLKLSKDEILLFINHLVFHKF